MADAPALVATQGTTALRSGNFGLPVLIWSHPRRWEGTGEDYRPALRPYSTYLPHAAIRFRRRAGRTPKRKKHWRDASGTRQKTHWRDASGTRPGSLRRYVFQNRSALADVR